jgi:hypothetical protein
MALITGPLVEYSSLSATGLVAAAVALPPLAIWLAMRLHPKTPQVETAD